MNFQVPRNLLLIQSQRISKTFQRPERIGSVGSAVVSFEPCSGFIESFALGVAAAGVVVPEFERPDFSVFASTLELPNKRPIARVVINTFSLFVFISELLLLIWSLPKI